MLVDVSDGIDADKYLRGVLFNQWKGADRELQIANSMSGASSTAGSSIPRRPSARGDWPR